MRTRFLSIIALALFTAAAARFPLSAQEPAEEKDVCAIDITEEKINNPQRKTKFERVETAHQERLVDVKLVEQKYVAVIQIKLPPRSANRNEPNFAGQSQIFVERGRKGGSGDEERKLFVLQAFGPQYFLSPQNESFIVLGESVSDSLQRWIDEIPAERRPLKEDVALFTSKEVERLLVSAHSASTRNDSRRTVRILATSAEEAESRARSFLTILDLGFSRPLQLGLLEKRKQACKEIADYDKQFKDAREAGVQIAKMLEEYADFTVDMLPGLRLQQLQHEVDLAGVKARLATCDKLLKGGLSADRHKQVEDVKIAAEIELSGIQARQAKAAELVAKVRTKGELADKANQAAGKQGIAAQRRQTQIKRVQQIDLEIAGFGPVAIEDDRVTIQPIEWVQR